MQVEEAAVAEDQPDEAEGMSKVQKLLDTERTLKQQSVNMLAEIGVMSLGTLYYYLRV